jgi:hypothetical protein
LAGLDLIQAGQGSVCPYETMLFMANRSVAVIAAQPLEFRAP